MVVNQYIRTCLYVLKYINLASITIWQLQTLAREFNSTKHRKHKIVAKICSLPLIYLVFIAQVYAFGRGDMGRLGLGDESSVKSPTLIPSLSYVQLIALVRARAVRRGKT